MLNGCLNNTASAQEALYNRFSPRMLGVCYRFARNKEDAEDIFTLALDKKHLQSLRDKLPFLKDADGFMIKNETPLNLP